jgi:beta-galactosidase
MSIHSFFRREHGRVLALAFDLSRARNLLEKRSGPRSYSCRTYDEVSRIAHELQKSGPEIADTQRRNKVAILYGNDSYYGIEFMKFCDRANYRSILRQMYGVTYRANEGVDFVFPESTNLSYYKVILVPPLYFASDAVLARLAKCVRGGGSLVVSLKSGFCNEFSTVRWEMAPGSLREPAGVHYQEFSSLHQPLAL